MEGVGIPSLHLPLKRSIASTTLHSFSPPVEHFHQRQQLQGLVEYHLPLPPLHLVGVVEAAGFREITAIVWRTLALMHPCLVATRLVISRPRLCGTRFLRERWRHSLCPRSMSPRQCAWLGTPRVNATPGVPALMITFNTVPPSWLHLLRGAQLVMPPPSPLPST